MQIGGIYSFNGGKEELEMNYATELQEIKDAIAAVDSIKHKNKVSKEKTMSGRILYRPGSLNKAFKESLVCEGGAITKSRLSILTSFTRPIMKDRKLCVAHFGKWIL